MKATVTASGLASAAGWIARIVPARPPVPVLGGVLIEATSDDVSLSAFDYETSGVARLGDATMAVDEPGRALVSGRLLAALAKTLGTADAAVEITTGTGAQVTVQVGRSRWALPAMAVEDYPAIPAAQAVIGTIDAATLVRGIERVVPCVDPANAVVALSGPALDFDGSTVTFLGTDRYRFAMDSAEWMPDAPPFEHELAMCPADLMRFVASAVHGVTTPVSLHLGDSSFGISTPGRTVIGRLLAGEYVKWRSFDLQPDTSTAFTAASVVTVAELKAAIARASVLLEDHGQLQLRFSPDGVEAAVAGEQGDADHVAQVVGHTGDDLSIRVNPDYLRTALDGMGSDVVRVDMQTPTRPFLVRPVDQAGEVIPGFRHLVMPVRPTGDNR